MKNKILVISLILIAIIVGGYGQQYFNNSVVADSLSFDEQEATIRAIQKVIPAVVSIIIEQEQDVTIITNKGKQTQKQKKQIGKGTGFLVSDDGLILTNKHVINIKKGIYSVILNNGKKYEAKLVDVDPLRDLAVLKIDGQNFQYAQLGDSNELMQGMTVIAIGNSLGRYQNTVTKGIVSALQRDITASDDQGNTEDLTDVIQTDAEINPGNSGGPLINLNGEVVGINTAIDHSGSNISFAILSNEAVTILKSIKENGKIIRPMMGVRYITIDESAVEEYKLKRNYGAYIISDQNSPAVIQNSPAHKAGIQRGDIIFEVEGIQLGDKYTLFSILQHYKVGQTIQVKIQRENSILVKYVTLSQF